jgi:hypothetical protein
MKREEWGRVDEQLYIFLSPAQIGRPGPFTPVEIAPDISWIVD